MATNVPDYVPKDQALKYVTNQTYRKQLDDQHRQQEQDQINNLAMEEEAKRKALGLQQKNQIFSFADEQQGRANTFRTGLAESLTNRGRDAFNLMNPSILEDLNARGLFTSQTARDQSQANAIKEIELANQEQLGAFDRDVFNDISDIRSSGISALLGGDQSALDAALELRKAGIQRRFDEADMAREQAMTQMLSRRQSRDQMVQGLLGLGGNIIGGLF